uniref:Uncharacterized protein n=1 Tax=Glossina pallidipes TaxID=7398 RepID=A0A1B0A0U9_GLOPL
MCRPRTSNDFHSFFDHFTLRLFYAWEKTPLQGISRYYKTFLAALRSLINLPDFIFRNQREKASTTPAYCYRNAWWSEKKQTPLLLLMQSLYVSNKIKSGLGSGGKMNSKL